MPLPQILNIKTEEDTMSTNTWESNTYFKHAHFVADLATPVIGLLNPQKGEHILDLGCGDGRLTKAMQDLGCVVTGVDYSDNLVKAAKTLGVNAHQMDAHHLTFEKEFDAVFSNAALHWMTGAEEVIAGVKHALKPKGRFVAEFGGHGNIQSILDALQIALAERGINLADVNPWYFPTPDEYRTLLEAEGFRVDYIELIPRPTPLPTDILGWLAVFANSFTKLFPENEQEAFLKQVMTLTAPNLQQPDGSWSVDYVRLRFAAYL
jgi:trans-aconitate methyltransferase